MNNYPHNLFSNIHPCEITIDKQSDLMPSSDCSVSDAESSDTPTEKSSADFKMMRDRQNSIASSSSDSSSNSSSDCSSSVVSNIASCKKRSKPSSKSGSSGKSKTQSKTESRKNILRPPPLFYYVDRSQQKDDDPLVPLTPHHRIPNFLVKLFCILSRDDMSHAIKWLPHGRSWRIVDPVEFETTVIPRYFGHASLPSFMRQVNGWGFKRMTKGRNKNSYYNEFFLRGLPHLLKKAPRPGEVNLISDKNHEPDLSSISEMYPVPQTLVRSDECKMSIEVIDNAIREQGPKCRVALPYGSGYNRVSFSSKNDESLEAELGFDYGSPAAKRRKSCENSTYGSVSLGSHSMTTSNSAAMSHFILGRQTSNLSSQASNLAYQCPVRVNTQPRTEASLLNLWKQHQDGQNLVQIQMEQVRQQITLEYLLDSLKANTNSNLNSELIRCLQTTVSPLLQSASRPQPPAAMPKLSNVHSAEGRQLPNVGSINAHSLSSMLSMTPSSQQTNMNSNLDNIALSPFLNSLQRNFGSVPVTPHTTNAANAFCDPNIQDLIQQAIRVVNGNCFGDSHQKRK